MGIELFSGSRMRGELLFLEAGTGAEYARSCFVIWIEQALMGCFGMGSGCLDIVLPQPAGRLFVDGRPLAIDRS